MGGSAQFRKKLQEKSKPQTAFEQVQARFGDIIAICIKGENKEGIAKGLIAMADKYGDDVIKMEGIYNESLPYGICGSTSLTSGQIMINGSMSDNYANGTYSVSGADGETQAAVTTVHELTHRITDFTATADIRELAKIEDAMLNKYGLSRNKYAEGIQKAFPHGWTASRVQSWLFNEKGFSSEDSYTLAYATAHRVDSKDDFCLNVINRAMTKLGATQYDPVYSGISKYASKKGANEAVPEAVADVAIHGDKASWASKAVYNAFNELLN